MIVPAAINFDFGFIEAHLDDFAQGLLRTLEISAIGIVGTLIVGVVGGGLSALRVPVLHWFVRVYVEFFRNTPLLVQIFFLYFAAPLIGLRLSGFTVGWLALVLWGGAYNAENFRAGFEAVEHGYTEAARALGFNTRKTFRYITLPIGWRVALPSIGNTLISVMKNSSFMIAISFPELTDTAVGVVAVTFRVFEVFLTIGIIYLALVWLLSQAIAVIEKRTTQGVVG